VHGKWASVSHEIRAEDDPQRGSLHYETHHYDPVWYLHVAVLRRHVPPSPRQRVYAIRAAHFGGPVADTQLSANVARLNANQTFTGSAYFNSSANRFAGGFSGNGAGVSNVNLATINSSGAITSVNPTLSFVLSSSPDAGDGSQGVVVADVNGDGRPSPITTNFQHLGITFSRDDGLPPVAYDYVAIRRRTPSPSNVVSTALVPGVADKQASHLEVTTKTPWSAVGAYFGNDRGDDDFTAISLTAFGAANQFLGTVQVTGNGNKHADQFIGLRSDEPIARVRFENLNGDGAVSKVFAVSLDDFVFVPFTPPK
jgi:hypothetical protein